MKQTTIERLRTANEKLEKLRNKFTGDIDWSAHEEESKGLNQVPLFEGKKEEIVSKLLTAPEAQIAKIFDEEVKKC
jgi:hypothetical protein